MVIRRRSPDDVNTYKCNEHDLFDGPWRIERFFNKIHSCHGVEGGMEGATKKVRAEAKEKMLTTKVHLSFPVSGDEKSKGPLWVEIGALIPLYGDILSKYS